MRFEIWGNNSPDNGKQIGFSNIQMGKSWNRSFYVGKCGIVRRINVFPSNVVIHIQTKTF